MNVASEPLEIGRGDHEETIGTVASALVAMGAVEGVGGIPPEDRGLESNIHPSSKSHTLTDGSSDERGAALGDPSLGASKRPRLAENYGSEAASHGTQHTETWTTTKIAGDEDSAAVKVPGSDSTTETTNRVVTLEDLYREAGIFKRVFSTVRTLAEAQATAANSHDSTWDPHTDLSSAASSKAPEQGPSSHTVTPGPTARPTPHPRTETSKLLRDKTTQIHQLERQVKEAQAHVTALEASNASLREEHQHLGVRLDKTSAALRIAGRNAAQARQDAAAAEAIAASVEQRFQEFRSVVEQTNQVRQQVQRQHSQMAHQVQQLEGQLVEALAQKTASDDNVLNLELRLQAARAANHTGQRNLREMQARYETSQESCRELELLLAQERDLEKGRRARSQQLAHEHHQAQELLDAATRSATETDKLTHELKVSLQTVQDRNTELSEELQQQQSKALKDQERLNAALTKAMVQAQQSKMQLEAQQELHAQQSTKWEQRVEQLQEQLRRRVRGTSQPPEAEAAPSSDTNSNAKAGATHRSSFSLPPLPRTSTVSAGEVVPMLNRDLDRHSGIAVRSGAVPFTSPRGDESQRRAPDDCCLCWQAASGMMNTCQCGSVPACRMRAHRSCVQSRLPTVRSSDPVIFCGKHPTDPLE